jgi:hypothetical protein
MMQHMQALHCSTTTHKIAGHWAGIIPAPAAAAGNVHVCFDKKNSLAISYPLSSKS